MKYEVTTKQGKNFIVDDNEISLWLEFEDAFDITYSEAQEKLSRNSWNVITKLLFTAARLGGHTELKTYKKWAEVEFETFDIVGDEKDPKAEAEA